MKDRGGFEIVPGNTGGEASELELSKVAQALAFDPYPAEEPIGDFGERRPPCAQWVETPSARRIRIALAFAQEHGDLAVIHGGTGVGKTEAARRYASEGQHVWIAEMSGAANRLRPCLQAVARACGMPCPWGGAYEMEREIVEQMRRVRGLLVIDEAQHLDHPQLEELRMLHDMSGRGLALLGNDRFGSRIKQPEFAALASRMGARVHLPAARPEDVDALLAARGIEGAKARQRALLLSAPPGGLRALARALERGILAGGKGAKGRTSARGGAA